MDSEQDHKMVCNCGKTFNEAENLQQHVEEKTVEKTLEEVRRIGGNRFYKLLKYYEEDAHSGGIRDAAASTEKPLQPENATYLAKIALNQIINQYENHEATIQQVTS
jgi:hypothetical protein